MCRHDRGAPRLPARGRSFEAACAAAARPRWTNGRRATLLLLLLAPAGTAQQQQLVSSRIEVTGSEASLLLEFAGGETLAVDFTDGVARLNGNVVGPYSPGGASDRAWRGLLDSVQSLSGERLARRLDDWRPGDDLPEPDLRLLQAIAEALDGASAAAEPASAPDVRSDTDAGQEDAYPTRAAAPTPGVPTGAGGSRALAILGRSGEFLEAWATAISDLNLDEAEVRVGTDHRVPADASVDGSVIHVDGLLEVLGHVEGSVVVMDGRLALASGSRIGGDIRTLDAEVADGGVVLGGERVDLRRRLEEREDRLRSRMLDEARAQMRQLGAPSGTSAPTYLHRVRDAAGGVLGTAAAFALTGALTLLLSVLGGHRVRTVVDELARNPVGSTLAGFAGTYAVVPIFALGVVALAVTIIGIPALIVWVPLFPLAVSVALFAGFVGAAEGVGRWVLGLGVGWLARIDAERPFNARLAGIATLLLPFAAGSVFIALPLIDWVAAVLYGAGALACLLGTIAGFGAVLITRGGTATRWPATFDEGHSMDDEAWPAGEEAP